MLLKLILQKNSLRVFFEGAILMAADQGGCFLGWFLNHFQ